MVARRLLAVLLLAYACPAASLATARVFNGTNAPVSAYPAFASVYFVTANGSRFVCGGFVVHPSFVMTAGHCVVDAVLSSFDIYLNDAGHSRYAAVAGYTHPAYVAATPRTANDVGLIQLSIPTPVVPFPYVKNASLLAALPACAAVEVMGYGLSSDNSTASGYTTPLQVASLDYIPYTGVGHSGCVEQAGGQANYGYQWPTNTVGDDVCLGFVPPCAPAKKGYAHTCSGDSGGPAVAPDGTVFALVSRSEEVGCSELTRPGIYTNIGAPENAAWIAAVIGGSNLSALAPLFFAPPPPPSLPPPFLDTLSVDALSVGSSFFSSTAHIIEVSAAGGALLLCCVFGACFSPRRKRPSVSHVVYPAHHPGAVQPHASFFFGGGNVPQQQQQQQQYSGTSPQRIPGIIPHTPQQVYMSPLPAAWAAAGHGGGGGDEERGIALGTPVWSSHAQQPQWVNAPHESDVESRAAIAESLSGHRVVLSGLRNGDAADAHLHACYAPEALNGLTGTAHGADDQGRVVVVLDATGEAVAVEAERVAVV